MNTFISLQKLWYGDVLESAPSQADMETLLAALTEVKNVHGDTWGYEEADPETTEYLNALTGQNYYVDKTKNGVPTISFTMGEYEYQQKADLQGGEVIKSGETAIGWSRPTEMENIYKCVVALSKTGVYIIFPKAQIVAKGDAQDKNIGLGVTANCVDTGLDDVKPEYWIKKK